MRREQRARVVAETLESAFPHPDIPLNHRDPFTLLVAVALSAQCTDARVNLVTPALFELAPDARSMAQCREEDIRERIATCGLAKGKAQRLVRMAQQLVKMHGGEVPSDFESLEALPGVGHKTASVVMNQAFGYPAFPVDTHIYRLARRWGLSRGTSVEQVEKDLKRCFPKPEWGMLHLRMILWGRAFCRARACAPPCAICAQLALEKG